MSLWEHSGVGILLGLDWGHFRTSEVAFGLGSLSYDSKYMKVICESVWLNFENIYFPTIFIDFRHLRD